MKLVPAELVPVGGKPPHLVAPLHLCVAGVKGLHQVNLGQMIHTDKVDGIPQEIFLAQLHKKNSNDTNCRSGVQPTPNVSVLEVNLSIADVIRRQRRPFIVDYDLPPNTDHADQAALLRKR